METIINDLEILIDDIERDNSLTKEGILKNLYEIKQQLEDQELENNHSIEWDDLVD